MIKKDVRNFMQKVMPANQNSRAYQTSSMITTGALDGLALGSATAAGYQFINKAASLTNNFLTTMKNISPKPTNVSTAEMFPTNRLQSGPDIKQMLKSVKNVINGKSLSDLGITNGISIKSNKALELAEKYLGKGYKYKGNGRYLSKDGLKQVRMGTADILGKHGGGPHVNFEKLKPNPSKPGKNIIIENYHVYLKN